MTQRPAAGQMQGTSHQFQQPVRPVKESQSQLSQSSIDTSASSQQPRQQQQQQQHEEQAGRANQANGKEDHSSPVRAAGESSDMHQAVAASGAAQSVTNPSTPEGRHQEGSDMRIDSDAGRGLAIGNGRTQPAVPSSKSSHDAWQQALRMSGSAETGQKGEADHPDPQQGHQNTASAAGTSNGGLPSAASPSQQCSDDAQPAEQGGHAQYSALHAAEPNSSQDGDQQAAAALLQDGHEKPDIQQAAKPLDAAPLHQLEANGNQLLTGSDDHAQHEQATSEPSEANNGHHPPDSTAQHSREDSAASSASPAQKDAGKTSSPSRLSHGDHEFSDSAQQSSDASAGPSASDGRQETGSTPAVAQQSTPSNDANAASAKQDSSERHQQAQPELSQDQPAGAVKGLMLLCGR